MCSVYSCSHQRFDIILRNFCHILLTLAIAYERVHVYRYADLRCCHKNSSKNCSSMARRSPIHSIECIAAIGRFCCLLSSVRQVQLLLFCFYEHHQGLNLSGRRAKAYISCACRSRPVSRSRSNRAMAYECGKLSWFTPHAIQSADECLGERLLCDNTRRYCARLSSQLFFCHICKRLSVFSGLLLLPFFRLSDRLQCSDSHSNDSLEIFFVRFSPAIGASSAAMLNGLSNLQMRYSSTNFTVITIYKQAATRI